MRTVIDLVRHAQTTYGAESRYAGSVDVPLSEQGRADSVQAARALAGERYDIVVTSTQRRAVETADLLVADPTVPRTASPLAVERRFGVLEGKTYAEVDAVEPPILFIEVGGDRHSVNPAGAEPFEDVYRRAQLFAAELLSQHAGRRILVVSHGVFGQMFTGVLRSLSCIECLAIHLSNLELVHHELEDGRLAGLSHRFLTGVDNHGF